MDEHYTGQDGAGAYEIDPTDQAEAVRKDFFGSDAAQIGIAGVPVRQVFRLAYIAIMNPDAAYREAACKELVGHEAMGHQYVRGAISSILDGVEQKRVYAAFHQANAKYLREAIRHIPQKKAAFAAAVC